MGVSEVTNSSKKVKPDFRNVERGKRMLQEIIKDSERKDKERDDEQTTKAGRDG